MKTAKQYEDSLRKLNLKVYVQGELVKNVVDHPIIRPSLNSVKMTYSLAEDPQYQDLMTATSSLTGKKINRFCHLHQSTEDLIKKVKMQRLLGQKTAACFQRCVGMDAINAVNSVTFEMDQKLGTDYHKKFTAFLLQMQEEDWTVDGAMTDPKGDRNLAAIYFGVTSATKFNADTAAMHILMVVLTNNLQGFVDQFIADLKNRNNTL